MMKLCDNHPIDIPLLFTMVFAGAENWCPVCCKTFDVFGSGKETPWTRELGHRASILARLSNNYLADITITYTPPTIDELLRLEATEVEAGPDFTCDGCGVVGIGMYSPQGDAVKPASWYSRSDEDGQQVACSMDCIDKISAKTGKQHMVMPW